MKKYLCYNKLSAASGGTSLSGLTIITSACASSLVNIVGIFAA
jgi:hypothetical protein